MHPPPSLHQYLLHPASPLSSHSLQALPLSPTLPPSLPPHIDVNNICVSQVSTLHSLILSSPYNSNCFQLIGLNDMVT